MLRLITILTVLLSIACIVSADQSRSQIVSGPWYVSWSDQAHRYDYYLEGNGSYSLISDDQKSNELRKAMYKCRFGDHGIRVRHKDKLYDQKDLLYSLGSPLYGEKLHMLSLPCGFNLYVVIDELFTYRMDPEVDKCLRDTGGLECLDRRYRLLVDCIGSKFNRDQSLREYINCPKPSLLDRLLPPRYDTYS